jgi:hypothetical protein
MSSRLTRTINAFSTVARYAMACAVLVIAVSSLLFLPGCSHHNLNSKTEYQAVFLVNGQTFIGKLEDSGSDYPKLTDVFYIQSTVNQETKAVTNVLVKRGKELHGPEFMYINSKNIIMIEPVSADSQVAKLIKEAKAQKS